MISLLQPGVLLQNRYVIQRELGHGGMGAVYLALDTRLGNKPLALKENFDSSPEAQAQFQNEANILANLSHPNLPRVTDHFVEPSGRQYLVMDYVAGKDLKSMVEGSGPLQFNQAVQWTIQVLNALAYLHSQNPPVIHRDIKPANIRITPEGRAMLVDFGISKVGGTSSLTATGARAVSPGFSPIEQYGQGRTEPRSDIYALGATLYLMLTGSAPPEAVDLMSRQATLVPPVQLNRAIPSHVERVVLQAMQLDMRQRYASASEMKQALVTPSGSSPQRYAPQANVTAPAVMSASTPVARPSVAAPPLPQSTPRASSLSLPLGMAVADHGPRFVAYVIDGMIITALMLVAAVPCWIVAALASSSGSSSSDAGSVLALLSAIPALIVSGWYYVHFHAKTGQTPGKKWLHIKVVGESGNLISNKRALSRWFVFWSPILIVAMGSIVAPWCGFLALPCYLLPLLNPNHRALHDIIAKTYVVKG